MPMLPRHALGAGLLTVFVAVIAVVPAFAQQIKTPGTACLGPQDQFFWEQSSICPSGTLVYQRPAFQFGASTSQTCNSGLAGMVQWTGTAASPNNTLQYCNGSSWANFAAASSGILLGASATATNPQASGDAGTGLFSATASTVSVATAGVEAMRITATQSVGIGVTAPTYLLQVGTGGTNNTGFGVDSSGTVKSISGDSNAELSNRELTFHNTGGTAIITNGTGGLGSSTLIIGALSPVDGYLQLRSTGAIGSGDYVEIQGGNNGSTRIARFMGTGKVGIGTIAPLSQLDVNGGMAVGAYAGTATATSNGLIVSGNVGIATASPATTLDVNGTVNATTAYYLSASQVLTVPSFDAGLTSLAVGFGALTSLQNTATSYYNTAVGINALSATTTGVQNTAIGTGALQYTSTSNYNTAIGEFALRSNRGDGNVAVGKQAGALNSGSYNTIMGTQSLYITSTGSRNTSIGAQALYQFSGTGNSNNVALGYTALYGATGLTVGRNNTGVGTSVLYAIQSGNNNTAVGYQVASTTLTTGSNNILIGTSSLVDTTASNSSNQLNIGNALYGTSVGTAGQAMLGLGPAPQTSLDLSSRTDALIVQSGTTGQRPGSPVAGMIRYNTTRSAFEFYENGSWVNHASASDARLKTEIRPVQRALDMLAGVRPVYYRWDRDNPRNVGMDDRRHVGFLAQDLEEVLPEVVTVGADTYRSVEYGPIVAVAVGAVKEMNVKAEGIEARDRGLERDIAKLKKANESLREQVRELKEDLDGRACPPPPGP